VFSRKLIKRREIKVKNREKKAIETIEKEKGEIER
jgi:hypothetical protein